MTTVLFSTNPLLTAAVVLLGLVVILLLALLVRSFSQSTRQAAFGRELAEALAAALEKNRNEDRTAITVQVNAVRSDLLAVSDAIQNEQHAAAMTLTERLTHAQESQGVRDREMLQAVTQQLALFQREQTAGSTELTRAVSELKAHVAEQLAVVRQTNREAADAVRATVEEKLQDTLSERLSASFKTVEAQLAAVHRGLGEMREMAQNVDGLRRVLTNVKTRGTFGEVQLAMILADILTPEQYDVNVATRPNASERVEFAVKLPGRKTGETVYLPIDSKFPLEDYERLLAASDAADADAVKASLKGLENRMLSEAKKIREKYVEVPYTTEFAVLYLPVESLWAEVLKIPGLVDRLQRECHVTVAGPTVLAALLNSLQMGFRTLAIEEKSAEVWRLLAQVKTEFERFTDAVSAVDKRVENVTKDLAQLKTRTNVMNRRLRDINPDAVLGKAVESAAVPAE